MAIASILILMTLAPIDRNPFLVQLAQTLPGKIVIATVFYTILATFSWTWSWNQAVFVGFIALIEIRKDYKLILILAYIFLAQKIPIFADPTRHLAQAEANKIILSSLNHKIKEAGYILPLAIFSALLLISGIFIRFFNQWRSGVLLLTLVVIHLAAISVALHLTEASFFYIYAWAFAISFSVCIFGIHLCVTNKCIPTRDRIFSGLFISLQGLMFGIPLPCFQSLEEIHRVQNIPITQFDKKKEAVNRLKAIKLLFWVRLLQVVSEVLGYTSYGVRSRGLPSWVQTKTFSLPNYSIIGFATYNSYRIPWYQSWGVVLLNGIFFIFIVTVGGGKVVAFFRLMGIYLPRAVYRPLQAKTFNEYFRRLLFYYSEVVINSFFYPVWSWLRAFKEHRTLRICLSIVISVFFGGMLFHIIWFSKEMVFYSADVTMKYLFSWIPYFGLISIMSCISATGIFRSLIPFKIPQLVSICLVFCTHAALLTLIGPYPFEVLSNRIVFWKSLFQF